MLKTQIILNHNIFFFKYFYRHAALMAISAVGEGCHKQMEAILPQIMDGIIQYLQDPVSKKIIYLNILPQTESAVIFLY